MEMYIHIWNDNNKAYVLEHTPPSNLEAAVKEYWQQLLLMPYVHTVLINSRTKQSYTFDIRDYTKNPQQSKTTPEYEKQTGHELGLCPGRV